MVCSRRRTTGFICKGRVRACISVLRVIFHLILMAFHEGANTLWYCRTVQDSLVSSIKCIITVKQSMTGGSLVLLSTEPLHMS
ncbi:hypothetical protein F4777DRAFT_259615 [Nemania sp. FL0916]|nr:hypothetical protein F4777DRAFT_259615 [Nemania sp. FL0916]